MATRGYKSRGILASVGIVVFSLSACAVAGSRTAPGNAETPTAGSSAGAVEHLAQKQTPPPVVTESPEPSSGVRPGETGPLPGLRLPAVTSYVAIPSEPTPAFKEAGARYLETLLTYDSGQEGVSAAKRRLEAAGLPSGPAEQAKRLISAPGPANVQVLYPQSGGQTATAGSVMAVLQLNRLVDGQVVSTTRTVDIRLKATGSNWRVVEIASDGGKAPSEPDTKAAGELMSNKNVVMTQSMKWDLESGIIDSRVKALVQDFSRDHTLNLTVFKTGHPYHVFNKSAVSNHSRGRAFDIWKIDGVTVADWGKRPVKGNPARVLMARALQLGSDEVGGPWAFGTKYGYTFTDVIHKDHLHLGFKH